MRQNAFNIVFFVILAGVVTAVWWYAEQNWLPKQERPKKDPAEVAADKQKKADEAKAKPPEKGAAPSPEAVAAVAGAATASAPTAPPPAPKAEVKPPPPPKFEPPTLVALGDDKFAIHGLLTTRGGGVQQVVLTWFPEANRLGKEEKLPDGTPVPLYLIPGTDRRHGPYLKDEPPLPDLRPGVALDPHNPNTPQSQRLVEPSYTLFHYAAPDDKYPDPFLGETNWKVVDEQHPADGPHSVTFEAKLPPPHALTIRKTFTLGPKDYHIGMRVEFKRAEGAEKGKAPTRFQVSGPRGLPVEGEWYTSTTRVALIGWKTPKGAFKRQFEDAATIGMKRGGDPVNRADNTFQYAAIATQYFTSAIAVDPGDDKSGKGPWGYVRATSELDILPSAEEIKRLEEAAKERPHGIDALELARVRDLQNRKLPELDDITVRAVTDPLDLGPGETAAQKYALYNGPTKVRLLKLLRDDRAVDETLVDHYLDDFGLRTLTDYHSPTAIGRFADAIYWTDLVIACTNVMHWLLWAIHSAIAWLPGSWGFSIIVLTVMVRLLLFVPSRKQTQMNMKMVEIQKKMKPELDKLQEKYKDDPMGLQREKSRLMMQHGMNPFAAMGGCLLLFAQMPIMMGLYFGLQESIFFRLENFLWITNLAAPDMAVWWGEHVPVISEPDGRHGTFAMLYLGPYLNVLPLISVALMLYQQNKMMPPPTDDQMAAQQRMMKIMMGVMALLFYKVAAGLALYFTISTLWGLIERQFIPKPKLGEAGTGAALPPRGGSPNGPAVPPKPPKPPGLLGRFREKLQERLAELQKQAEEQASRQHKNQPRGSEPFRNPDRGDRKKKRRK